MIGHKKTAQWRRLSELRRLLVARDADGAAVEAMRLAERADDELEASLARALRFLADGMIGAAESEINSLSYEQYQSEQRSAYLQAMRKKVPSDVLV